MLDWGDRATAWYIREQDHRGWIPEQGWANAIAHGADLLAALARSRHFGRLELTVLLDVIADRVLTPTAYIWRHGEEDRLAYAVMTLLHRNALDPSIVEPWLARLGDGIKPPRTRGHLEAEWPSARRCATRRHSCGPFTCSSRSGSRAGTTCAPTPSCSPSSRRTVPICCWPCSTRSAPRAVALPATTRARPFS